MYGVYTAYLDPHQATTPLCYADDSTKVEIVLSADWVLFSMLVLYHNSLLVPHLKRTQRKRVCERLSLWMVVKKNVALLVCIRGAIIILWRQEIVKQFRYLTVRVVCGSFLFSLLIALLLLLLWTFVALRVWSGHVYQGPDVHMLRLSQCFHHWQLTQCV